MLHHLFQTSLLAVLSLIESTGLPYGDVRLNGEPLTRRMFQQHMYYVPQFPTNYAFVTPREALTTAARLSTAKHDGEATARVEALLDVMGLRGCADAKIGNDIVPGLSAGQRKRVAIAVGVMSRPKVLCLDEPTTSIDAAAAAGIMKFLRSLAKEANICVICTVHQPPAAVFAGFDEVMVMTRGQTAYTGSAAGMVPYFCGIGHELPANTTAPEWVLDLVNDEFTDKAKVWALVETWKARETAAGLAVRARDMTAVDGEEAGTADDAAGTADADGVDTVTNGNGERARPTLCTEVGVLLRRQWQRVKHDPTLYTGRAIAFLGVNLFFAVLYIESRERDQTVLLQRVFYLMWCVGTATNFALLVVYSANSELHVVKNEVRNGMVRPVAAVVANSLLQVPLLLLTVCVGYIIPFYVVMDSDPGHMLQTIILITCTMWSYDSIAEAYGVLFSNFLVGMLQFLQVWFAAFLFAGVVIPQESVPWPFKLFTWMSPLRWTLRSVVRMDMVDSTFAGAQLSGTSPLGYECPGDTSGGAACFGRTGSQVLTSLHANFETFSSEDTLGTDIVICLGIAVGFKLVYIAIMLRKTVAHALPVRE